MDHMNIKLPSELILPVKVSIKEGYWMITDAAGYVFMGRKNQEKAIKSIAWYLNNSKEIKQACDNHDKLVEALSRCVRAMKAEPYPNPHEGTGTLIEAEEVLKSVKKA